jgi:UDP-N-acetylmuramoyl-tripeptide--D-alanyl-D-alanine ligase
MFVSRFQKFSDLLRLYRAMPGSAGIFLRREYDRYFRLLRRLAKAYRLTALRRTRIVVVVGSLGKTTSMRAIQAALGCPDRRFSHSNYGSSLAVNTLRVRPGDPHAVIEAGVDGPGPMGRYAEMLRPDVVVVTSIKSEHNRSFPSLLDTRAEKVKMVRALSERGLAVLNGDDPNVRWMAGQTTARVVTVGLGPDNDVRAAGLRDLPNGMAFTAVLDGAEHEVRIRFAGRHMVFPFLAALAVAVHEGVPAGTAVARLGSLEPKESRMQLHALPGGVTILDDSYKGALESVLAALDVLATLPSTRRIVVFGGVDEPPGRQGDVNREIGRRIGEVSDVVLCLGTGLSGVRAGAVEMGMSRESVLLLAPDYRLAVDWLERELRPGDSVLIKGQSALCMRRIVLSLRGRHVSCTVAACKVKVPSCEQCPLIDAPPELFRNCFVARYVRG